jgi:hypothetical protein
MSWGLSISGLATTMQLLESLQFSVGDEAAYIVGPTVNYAVFVDRGTSKMEARPFVRPAAERVQANLETEVGRFLDGDLGDSSMDAITRAAALAVQREMQRIITQKGAVDTGTLRSSVSVARVS